MDRCVDLWRIIGMAPLSQHIFVVVYTTALIIGLVALMIASPQTAHWAAWLQAIGSVGALGTMVYVQREGVLDGQRREDKARHQLARAQIDILVITLANFNSVLAGCEATSAQAAWTRIQIRRRTGEFGAIVMDLQKIEFSRIECATELTLIFRTRSLAFQAQAVLAEIGLNLTCPSNLTAFALCRQRYEEIWQEAAPLLPDGVS